jgi:CubicO group peptidase (beta-lactamase class C family)
MAGTQADTRDAADLPGRIQDAAHELTVGGAETGPQIAVIRYGEVAADVAVGVTDPATGRPVTSGTLFWAASAAKGMASSVVHVLAERGELDYDLRVADVWPEFAAHGKDAVTVRHLLCHTAGVPSRPPGTTADDLCDLERVCALLADAEPRWLPGTRFGYHSDTFGYGVRLVSAERLAAMAAVAWVTSRPRPVSTASSSTRSMRLDGP